MENIPKADLSVERNVTGMSIYDYLAGRINKLEEQIDKSSANSDGVTSTIQKKRVSLRCLSE